MLTCVSEGLVKEISIIGISWNLCNQVFKSGENTDFNTPSVAI